jgi:hypothetical protein
MPPPGGAGYDAYLGEIACIDNRAQKILPNSALLRDRQGSEFLETNNFDGALVAS